MAGAKLIVMYPHPQDADRFENVYHNEHVPMAVPKLSGKTKIVATKVLAMIRLRVIFYSLVTVLLVSLVLLTHLWARNTEGTFKGDNADRRPVLVELFTSEGCSDCPPADALLARLDRSQPIEGAELIVLSEHVDYWNGIGWHDPYSSPQYSQRQNAYAELFRIGSVYTPQMVVDGRYEFVGSDQRGATEAIENATKTEKVAVNLTSAHLESDSVIAVHVDAGRLPPSISGDSANVWLAVADEQDESHVNGGENGGRTLRHVAVVRTLEKIGKVDRSDQFSRDVRVNVGHGRGKVRLIAFLQEMRTGSIVGVSRVDLAN